MREHVAAALVEYGGGVVELLSAAERMHSGDAGSVLSGLLWEMKQALGPAMASGRLYEDEALLELPLWAFPGSVHGFAPERAFAGSRAWKSGELCGASRADGCHRSRDAGRQAGWLGRDGRYASSGAPAVCASFRAGGTGHVIIPRGQTTIPTRSKKRARCRVAEMGSDSRITVSMGQELSRYAGCEEGQTAALRSWKISELQTPFAGYPAELELELMVGLDIRAAGSGCRSPTGRRRELSVFFYRFVSEAVAEEWFGGKSDGKQDDGADSYGTCGEASEKNTAHLAMPVSDQSGNSWDWATTMRTSRVQAEQEAAVLKGLQQVLKQSEAFLQKQVLQHYVGGATTSHPEELVPEALAAVTEQGLAPTAAIAEEMFTILDSLGVWPAWNFRSCKWGREDHGRLLQRAAPGSETVSECDTGGSACDAV